MQFGGDFSTGSEKKQPQAVEVPEELAGPVDVANLMVLILLWILSAMAWYLKKHTKTHPIFEVKKTSAFLKGSETSMKGSIKTNIMLLNIMFLTLKMPLKKGNTQVPFTLAIVKLRILKLGKDGPWWKHKRRAKWKNKRRGYPQQQDV